MRRCEMTDYKEMIIVILENIKKEGESEASV